jgi:hypothetical protein
MSGLSCGVPSKTIAKTDAYHLIDDMRFLRFFGLAVVALAAFCSVMVVREFSLKNSRHAELRESLILLQAKGYPKEAERLYERLVFDLRHCPDKLLLEDWQRTGALIDPTKKNTDDLVWRYYTSVNNELNRRGEINFPRALNLAGGE